MKRRKKQDDHIDESWLIPYADIMTLLLALFIVLFAASEIDSQKFKEIAQSFNSELQGGSGVLEEQTAGNVEAEPEPVEDPIGIVEEPTDEELEEIALAKDLNELNVLQEKISDYIRENGMGSTLTAEITTKGLLLKIKEGVLYESGSADISEESQTIASEISNLLVTDPPRNVYIEGHTDDVPTGSTQFPSNWELSSARAVNFMKELLENDELDPRRFSATGYGEYHPIASNETAEGRAENRRVEVLISLYSDDNE